ncbi:unnamed protein product [Linum tenue]|uniref:Uncharacterized protein n=1 Tax=Linum tenue TaxID=586396 RepID=A0AAV0QSC3_9ROSI|nr:unnamed protein product [Linum tenue]
MDLTLRAVVVVVLWRRLERGAGCDECGEEGGGEREREGKWTGLWWRRQERRREGRE